MHRTTRNANEQSGPEHYETGETLEVKIEKIVPGGSGLAFAENLTVFVPLSAPGDKLRVRINKIKGRTAFAEIEEVIEPSTLRVEPPCPYFGACGGCDFQQLNYAAQLDAKTAIIRDCLHRIAKIEYENEIPVVASPQAFDYRLRAQWHADTQNRTIGYFRRESHDVIDVDHCPIATPALNRVLADLRSGIEWANIWSNRIAIEAAVGDNGEASTYSSEILNPTNEISIRAHGEAYTFSAQTFFQGNQYLIEKLIDLTVEGTSAGTAIDLFCGVGLFSLPLARKFRKVIGVESNELAIEFAKKNAANAGLANIEFVSDGVEKFLRHAGPGEIDLIVFDPPRSGTSKDTIFRMLALKPKTISYVSCEPSILARDLRWLLDRGCTIESITALDLFPQTHHVETIVRLSQNHLA